MDTRYLIIDECIDGLINILKVWHKSKTTNQDRADHTKNASTLIPIMQHSCSCEKITKEIDGNLMQLTNTVDKIDYLEERLQRMQRIKETCNLAFAGDVGDEEQEIEHHEINHHIWEIANAIYDRINACKLQVRKEMTHHTDVDDNVKLKYKGLPGWTTGQRYKFIEKVLPDLVNHIYKINAPTKSKEKVFAIILDCSPDTAKHLANGTYPPLQKWTAEDESRIDTYINQLEIEK